MSPHRWPLATAHLPRRSFLHDSNKADTQEPGNCRPSQSQQAYDVGLFGKQLAAPELPPCLYKPLATELCLCKPLAMPELSSWGAPGEEA